MKIIPMFAAAGLVIAGLGASTAADAQNWRGDRYGQNRDYRDGGRGFDRGHDRGYRDYRGDRGRHYGWDRGRRYGYNSYRGGPRCWTEYRYDHRVRVCR